MSLEDLSHLLHALAHLGFDVDEVLVDREEMENFHKRQRLQVLLTTNHITPLPMTTSLLPSPVLTNQSTLLVPNVP